MNKFDHRHLGNSLELFHQQDISPGMIFWHPRGWTLYRILEDYVRNRMREAGFREVRTPQLAVRALWERSGHWEKFQESMYSVRCDDDISGYCLKPMSCPCHVQIFNQRARSYRELPLRFAEFGVCHRDEPSGSLEGLKRTRAFTQDDAHVFCAEHQVLEEVARFCRLLNRMYGELGFDGFLVKLATRPALHAGTGAIWDRAEEMLAEAASSAGLEPEHAPGEGAFYGPKLEFHLKDSRARSWQCGTIQLDFVLPERLDVQYIDEHNRLLRPVMLHHAVLGSLERFIAILIEHYEGWLPLWLAPDQVVVATVSGRSAGYASMLVDSMKDAGLRVYLDDRAERLEKKVLDARKKRIPAFIAVGPRDEHQGTFVLRLADGSQIVQQAIEGIARLQECARGPE